MDVYWIPFYEDVQIFLSTPFQTLPDQKISGSNRTDKSENSEKFPPGVFTPAWNPEYLRSTKVESTFESTFESNTQFWYEWTNECKQVIITKVD